MKLATGALTYVGPVAAINPALYKDLGFNFIRDIACRHERRPQNHPTAHSRPLCAHHRRARHTTVSAIKRGDRSLSEFDDRRQDPQETRWRSSSPDSTSCRRSSTRALDGDVQCGALVTKIIERRCVMLGLSTPRTTVLQIVEVTPRKIERVLAELAAQDGKKSDPTAH